MISTVSLSRASSFQTWSQWRKLNNLQSQLPPPSLRHAWKTSISQPYPLPLILTPLLPALGERKRHHSKLVETMQTAKAIPRNARGQPSPPIFLQCDTSCLCQRQLTMNPPKPQHFHPSLVERSGWSPRNMCITESLSDTRKQFPILPFPPFNTIVKQRQPLARASNPRTRRLISFSLRLVALRSPLRKDFVWHEQPLAPGKAGTIGKLRF